MWVSVASIGRLHAGMASQELDFPLDDVVEGDSAVVDVVVAALAAMKFRSGCAIGHGECGTDRCLGVGLGDDEQDRDADVARVAYWPVGGDAQQCPCRHPVVPGDELTRGRDFL